MGWLTQPLQDTAIALERAKRNHIEEPTQRIDGAQAEMLAHEWRYNTWYAIIRLTFPEGHADRERYGETMTYLLVDLIEICNGSFGYKAMEEDMGPCVDEGPSPHFCDLIYKHIPIPRSRFAISFREKWGIRWDETRPVLAVAIVARIAIAPLLGEESSDRVGELMNLADPAFEFSSEKDYRIDNNPIAMEGGYSVETGMYFHYVIEVNCNNGKEPTEQTISDLLTKARITPPPTFGVLASPMHFVSWSYYCRLFSGEIGWTVYETQESLKGVQIKILKN